MDLIPRVHRLPAILASICRRLRTRAIWPACLVILATCLLLVAWMLRARWATASEWVTVAALLIFAAIVLMLSGMWKRFTWPLRLAILALYLAWMTIIVPGGIVSVIVFLIAIAVVLVWIITVLSRWQHLSWPVRLLIIDGGTFATYLVILIILKIFVHKQIPTKFTSIIAWIVVYVLFLAGLTSIERLIAKVTAATSARVIVGLAIAFTYLFPSTLVFLATDGDVDTFKLALFFFLINNFVGLTS